MHKSIKDITGKIFGYLTVQSYSHSLNGITYWNCFCICGNKKIKCKPNLIQGKNISCGCKTSELISKSNSLPETEASFNNIFRQYKFRRKNDFHLTKDQFKELTQQNCHYCDSEPKTYSNTDLIRHNKPYVYNGLDRIDNNLGYTLKNVVPCCEICNRMKLDMTYDQFILHIGKIYGRFSQKI